MQLLLIDDHPLIHLALQALLADFQPSVRLQPVLNIAAARAPCSRGMASSWCCSVAAA
ncbi:MAG: hypothetical protein U1E77_05510 [Inhella sp.]